MAVNVRRVRLVSRGVRELLNSGPMAAAMLVRAELVADRARATAPVVSGAYRGSIVARSHQGATRYTGQAAAEVPYAQSVEARHRTLGRAIDAAKGT